MPNVKLDCDTCGKEFEISASALRGKKEAGHTQYFCSIACADKRHYKDNPQYCDLPWNIETTCKSCGKKITIKRHKYVRLSHLNHYCSKQCSSGCQGWRKGVVRSPSELEKDLFSLDSEIILKTLINSTTLDPVEIILIYKRYGMRMTLANCSKDTPWSMGHVHHLVQAASKKFASILDKGEEPEENNTTKIGPRIQVDLLDLSERRMLTDELLSYLDNERHRQVVKMRFYDGMSLEKIGRLLGVGRERVRQIEERALEVIRKKARGRISRYDLE